MLRNFPGHALAMVKLHLQRPWPRASCAGYWAVKGMPGVRLSKAKDSDQWTVHSASPLVISEIFQADKIRQLLEECGLLHLSFPSRSEALMALEMQAEMNPSLLKP